jgi:hypothetical protein
MPGAHGALQPLLEGVREVPNLLQNGALSSAHRTSACLYSQVSPKPLNPLFAWLLDNA